MTIEGKTALVTGSDRGIGQALIEEALRAGAPVPSKAFERESAVIVQAQPVAV